MRQFHVFEVAMRSDTSLDCVQLAAAIQSADFDVSSCWRQLVKPPLAGPNT